MTFVSQTTRTSIRIKIPENLLNHKNFQDELEETVFDIAREARDFWETTAGQRLTTSRIKYQDAIGMQQRGRGTVYLLLTSKFAQDVESGRKGFDMKPGFLRSKHIKPGPVKMPREVAATLRKTGLPPATKWMILPMNNGRNPVSRSGRFSSPTFKTFTDRQVTKWNHRGFKGVFISRDVVTELNDTIVPRHVERLIDRLYGGT